MIATNGAHHDTLPIAWRCSRPAPLSQSIRNSLLEVRRNYALSVVSLFTKLQHEEKILMLSLTSRTPSRGKRRIFAEKNGPHVGIIVSWAEDASRSIFSH